MTVNLTMKSLSLSQFLFCNKKNFFSKLLGSIGSLCPLFPAMVETHGWLCWGVCIQWAWGAQLSTPPHPHPSSTRQIHGPSPSLPVGGPPLNHFVAPCTPLGGLTVGPPDDFCSSNCPTLSLPTGNLRFPRCPSRDYQKLGLLSTRQGRGIFARPSLPVWAALPYAVCYQRHTRWASVCPSGCQESPCTSFLHPHRLVSNAWSQRSVFASPAPPVGTRRNGP